MQTKKILLLSLLALFVLSPVSAQDVSSDEAVSQDEEVSAQDLESIDPTILPDSPFYFFKTWGREIRSLITFDPVKKAELRERFSNEKLLELKKMVEEKRSANAIDSATENYENEVRKVKETVEGIKEKAKDSAEVSKFLDKYIQQQVLHQRILQKLEGQVPEETFERIKEARENHLERFGEVMDKLEERKEELQERLEENLDKVKGSEYKNFKSLEVLLNLEEKVPERAKEAIRGAQENSLKRLQGNLENMSPEGQERFKEYLDKINGEENVQLEILERVKLEIEDNESLKESLIQSRDRLIERARETIQVRGCPEIDKPDTDFCREGRINIKEDEKGCVVFIGCTAPAGSSFVPDPDKEVCAQVITYRRDPENGECKKLSNACEAPRTWTECKPTIEKDSTTEKEEDDDIVEKNLIEPFRKLIPTQLSP
ncbi:MAG: DUF5667 domain-containing protein [Candidatus Nealsonbacteria bacterium]